MGWRKLNNILILKLINEKKKNPLKNNYLVQTSKRKAKMKKKVGSSQPSEMMTTHPIVNPNFYNHKEFQPLISKEASCFAWNFKTSLWDPQTTCPYKPLLLWSASPGLQNGRIHRETRDSKHLISHGSPQRAIISWRYLSGHFNAIINGTKRIRNI